MREGSVGLSIHFSLFLSMGLQFGVFDIACLLSVFSIRKRRHKRWNSKQTLENSLLTIHNEGGAEVEERRKKF